MTLTCMCVSLVSLRFGPVCIHWPCFLAVLLRSVNITPHLFSGPNLIQSRFAHMRLFLSWSAGQDVHGDAQLLILTADQNATNRRHIAVVAPPTDRDMAQRRNTVVRWIHVDPANARTEEADPGVRGIHATKFGLP